MDIIEEKYIEKLQNGIMPVVKQWCSGASFKQISEDSGIFEGLFEF
jgi:superfamily II RNA helicase